MLFVDELARRGVRAYGADPGGAGTDITRDSTGLWGWTVKHNVLWFLAQSTPDLAIRSTIQAVTTDLPSGTCFAPRFAVRGEHRATMPRRKARDADMARRLWDLSVELTGCDWTVHPPARTPL